ncbi:hypothetical protein ONZ51_g1335 [Trametes cubensis]|uniref:DEK C-terminal domain-containing protein n=1 Tax=Trametes cubensis TaxID=1111947 RepID=A0AAD7XFK4_9APHY|nr:hypothetical protein ONZ51_g1335 [Trametes cubensis]
MELDIQQLRETALKVVTEVVEQGRLDAFTKKTFRREVEQVMSLPQGTLDASEYKDVVLNIAQDYISQHQEAQEEDEKGVTAAKKKKPSSASKKPKQSPDSKKQDTKAKPASKRPVKGKKPARSASVVPSSGDEGDGSVAVEPSATKPKPRGKAATKARRVESDTEGSAADSSGPPPAKRQKKPAASHELEPGAAGPSTSSPQAATDRKIVGHDVDEQRSESEMSVLVDEPPARKRKKKGENGEMNVGIISRTAKPTEGKKRKEPAKELSKDEETIKRLKSLVVACGVRKVWSKEFKGLDEPSDQIRRLRQILTDLGMSGRMSMEQAKAIKAKREFEKELEDVQEFANKVVAGPSSRRRGRKSSNDKAQDKESESEIDTAPKRRTARQSIMAFLGDESE